jgi:hypothetical protein
MKVSDQGNRDTHALELGTDRRHGCGSFGGIDGDAHQFRTGTCQLGALNRCSDDVDSIGIGHRLYHHRGRAADGDLADPYRSRLSTWCQECWIAHGVWSTSLLIRL